MKLIVTREKQVKGKKSKVVYWVSCPIAVFENVKLANKFRKNLEAGKWRFYEDV